MAKFELVLHETREVYDMWLTGTEQPADPMREGGKNTRAGCDGRRGRVDKDSGPGAGIFVSWRVSFSRATL